MLEPVGTEAIGKRKSPSTIYQRFIKRTMGFILALVALIVLSPLLICVALLVKTRLGSPVIFKQKRPGLHGKVFTMYKFRTMTNERDRHGELLPNHRRLTKLGRILRSTSLDELPELFNVLKGDMALVGPRPLLKEYLPLYNDYQRRRHEVRPGLTGLAQVNGRNATTWDERFNHDVNYVDNVSFFLDCRIIVKTISTVFSRKGVNAGQTVTMEKFRGQ